MRRYLTNSIENMRDLGGYTSKYGKIKYGKIIRSNVPTNLNTNELAYLKSIGIKTIIDLRSEPEFQERPSIFEKDPEFDVKHFIVKGGNKMPKTPYEVAVSYLDMTTDTETMYNVFKTLDMENSILYFCTAGKDRTGIVSALILMTLGVNNNQIIENYISSKEYLKDNLKNYIEQNNLQHLKDVIIPNENFMRTFLKLFEEKYSNIEQYLKIIGISEQEIANIRSKYIE